MNTSTWISTTVSRLLPAGSPKSKEKEPHAVGIGVSSFSVQ